MKLGMLITSIGNFGKKGFYNAQEIGLAREMDKLFDEVNLYKAVPESEERVVSGLKGCNHTTCYQIPVKSQGINGIWDCSIMDKTMDALLFFSDTQLSVPDVYQWCRQNSVPMYPYIGVIESHSTNKIKKLVIDQMFKKNLKAYKECTCFVKTPAVQKALNAKGVKNTVVTPVGLDVTLLRQDYADADVRELKKKYGYQETDKVLLFIGRMTAEKHPMKMIEIFRKLYRADSSYRLLMVGKGELLEEIKTSAVEINAEENKKGNKEVIQMIEQIPNQDIWKLYRIADCFVNLNQQEIFGMAILEAMYYGCKVVAMHAPGPDFIIEDGVSGCLADDEKNMIGCIKQKYLDPLQIHKRIIENFTWQNTAETIYKIIAAG